MDKGEKVTSNVEVWINSSDSCVSMLSSLRRAGWNPIIKSHAHSVPIAEVDGLTFFGMNNIFANLIA